MSESKRIGSGLTDDTGTALPAKTDHVAEGLDHLIHELQDKQRMRDFVSAFLKQAQDLEDTYRQLFAERVLDTAVGAQLDGLGAIVGEERAGRDDDAYRRFIRVRILVNASDGRIEQLLAIARLVLNSASASARLTEYQPAAMTIEILSTVDLFPEEIDPEDLARAFRQAKAAGVGINTIISYTEDGGSFTWDSESVEPANVDAATGWGDTTDSNVGGKWASVIG